MLLIPLIAFSEACIGIGLVVSGIVLVAVSSILFTNDLASLQQIMVLAFMGAMLGDHVGFYVGHWLGPGFHDWKVAKRYQLSLQKGETMIRKHGSAAIFIGRFIPAIRSLIPALLGISRFDRLRYSMLDAAACLLWALALGAILLGVGNLF